MSDEFPTLPDILNDNPGVVGAAAGYAVNRSVQSANRNIEKLKKELGAIQTEMANARKQDDQEQRDRESVFQIGVQINEIATLGTSASAFLQLENLAMRFRRLNLSTASFRQLQDKEFLNSTRLRLEQAQQQIRDSLSEQTINNIASLQGWHQFSDLLKESQRLEHDLAQVERQLSQAEAKLPVQTTEEVGVITFLFRKLKTRFGVGRSPASFRGQSNARGFVLGADEIKRMRQVDAKMGGMIGFVFERHNRRLAYLWTLATGLAFLSLVLLAVAIAYAPQSGVAVPKETAELQGKLILATLVLAGLAAIPFTIVLGKWNDKQTKVEMRRAEVLASHDKLRARCDALRQVKSKHDEQFQNLVTIPSELRKYLCDSSIPLAERKAKASEVFAYTNDLKRSLAVEDKHLKIDS